MERIALIGIGHSNPGARHEAPAPPWCYYNYARKNYAYKPQCTEGIGCTDNRQTKPATQIEERKNSENGDTKNDKP